MVETTLTLDQFKAAYLTSKAALIEMEKMLGMPAFTPNRAEARALAELRRLGVPMADVVRREKARRKRGGEG